MPVPQGIRGHPTDGLGQEQTVGPARTALVRPARMAQGQTTARVPTVHVPHMKTAPAQTAQGQAMANVQAALAAVQGLVLAQAPARMERVAPVQEEARVAQWAAEAQAGRQGPALPVAR